MIHHMVLLRIRKDAAEADVKSAFEALAGLKESIPGIVQFDGGPYSSPEGLDRGFTHGFCMIFETAAARDAYLPHPAHEIVKAQVFDLLEGGLDGVIAFDFES